MVKDKKCVTVYLDQEELAALEDRMNYLQQKQGYGKVTKTDAVKHAIMQKTYRKETDL
jgi:hypothetical protein